MHPKTYIYPGTVQPLETPAPVLPDGLLDSPVFSLPPVPAPPIVPLGRFDILEADFELPPPAPELSWAGSDPSLPFKRTPPLVPEPANVIELALFGSVDYHPGYWQSFAPSLVSLARRPRLLSAPPSEVLLDSLYVVTVSLDWQSQEFVPPKGRQPVDVSAVITTSIHSVFAEYRRLFADSIRYYLTGAASDGATQADPDASLGGYRAGDAAEHGSYILLSAIPGLSIDYASRRNGPDVLGTPAVGTLVAAAANQVAYAGPGGALGDRVTLAVGESYVVADGVDPSKFVRVTRTTAESLLGVASLEYHDQYGNVVSMADADNDESTAGGDRYRAVMLRGASIAAVDSLRLFLSTLGTPTNVAISGSLPSSGAGTVAAATDAFADWPHQGWCRIADSGGTLREIVYYSARNGSALTVPSLGRGRLGTSTAAGADGDVLTPVPGVRIAWELASPAAGGAVQTIADEETAPTGVTWSTAIDADTGIDVGELSSGEQGALWIHRELPAGASPFSMHEHQIEVAYESEGESYGETLAGLYRLAVDAYRRLELRIGVDQLPDQSADPDETLTVPLGTSHEDYLAANPWTTTAELTDDAVNYLSVDASNEYGLRSETLLTATIALSGGEVADPPPTAPILQSVDAAAGGAFRVRGVYYYDQDGDAPGDRWLVFLSTDGSDPDPSSDTPTVVTFAPIGDGAAVLDWTSSTTYAGGTIGKALLRVRRSTDSVDSASTAILQATAVASSTATITGGLFYRRQAEG